MKQLNKQVKTETASGRLKVGDDAVELDLANMQDMKAKTATEADELMVNIDKLEIELIQVTRMNENLLELKKLELEKLDQNMACVAHKKSQRAQLDTEFESVYAEHAQTFGRIDLNAYYQDMSRRLAVSKMDRINELIDQIKLQELIENVQRVQKEVAELQLKHEQCTRDLKRVEQELELKRQRNNSDEQRLVYSDMAENSPEVEALKKELKRLTDHINSTNMAKLQRRFRYLRGLLYDEDI